VLTTEQYWYYYYYYDYDHHHHHAESWTQYRNTVNGTNGTQQVYENYE